ncbi:hypothetical protein [Wenxinia saemankumensis]|uniref:Uncharacterized protein n=1 Tax=Wenxinia saemankumensis TaxID=1447782 RepID=A0A1M6CRW0_9RHOB|nr:hypothetical protein [Wenxinia saemankumensis]SHI63762.1 hypothetical protein SAMN05444417_1335 [Wenxinia saemankumensis]
MSHRTPPGRAPDYTDAFLAVTGLLLFMALLTLAALAGWIWALLAGAALDRAILALPRRG